MFEVIIFGVAPTCCGECTLSPCTKRKKRGICQGYANLFELMCFYENIASIQVQGYSKGYGHYDNIQTEHILQHFGCRYDQVVPQLRVHHVLLEQLSNQLSAENGVN